MRKIALLFYCILIYGSLFADVGNCVRYKVRIYTTDADTIEGFIFINTYDPIFNFQEKSFKDYVKMNGLSYGMKISVYTTVKEILLPQVSYKINNCEIHLNAAPINTVKVLSFNNITDIEPIEFRTCQNCPNCKDPIGFNWIGSSPNVITELTENEIDLLQTQPFSYNEFSFPNDEYSSYNVISYNELYDSEKLNRLCDDFILNLKPLFDQNDWDAIEASYISFKTYLREKNIIIFKIEFAN